MPTIKYKLKNGTKVKGTTTIVNQNVGWGKQGLLYWANQQGQNGITLNEARDTATIPGTIAHYLIECWLKREQVQYDPSWTQEDIDKAKTAFDAFLTWSQQFLFEPVFVEPNLVSEFWQFGGTPDVIGKVQGSLALIDWKSGKIYESTILQLAAYEVLAEENGIGKMEGGFHILRIRKDQDLPGFHHTYWAKLPAEAFIAFRCCLTLSNVQKTLKDML